ncbi:3-deoxy-D-manno-octulosonate cytidylyltransferase [Selenomonas infelix ATCC 43532]|uniref:3-deoxy-manno-octulosonate cytidylyltransferase n=1 Tax=Selenomonas infelix ATCC 43532 TaxID=679201 RepID=G5GQI4_9FIRM|nr:3-deoxy-manno-octulosonate cytidylyltransferase [Selenomonas infelix]EHG20619.1 3-deoxy-D-manno-octulosonate cytidylyltransferase [Selenomonas infelix ATCC 43532]
MKVLCIIPARYASTRLPGKPLRDIAGKPMIVRVYERAVRAKLVQDVVVATDDERIRAAVEEHGGRAVMTRVDHATGTDRLAEVAEKMTDYDLIINVQGDEPLIDPAVIDALVEPFLVDETLPMATAKTLLMDEEEIVNPNNVKVITDLSGNALYFSRARIPYARNEGAKVYKHIGIYAYRRDFLLSYARMAQTPLELSESLEQLRALENGYTIRVIETDAVFIGVDTEEDLAAVNEEYIRRGIH